MGARTSRAHRNPLGAATKTDDQRQNWPQNNLVYAFVGFCGSKGCWSELEDTEQLLEVCQLAASSFNCFLGNVNVGLINGPPPP